LNLIKFFVKVTENCYYSFLPPYSPDFNSIELAFSTVKSWIKRNKDFMETWPDPEFAIIADNAYDGEILF
jgi:hypothetical protein